MKGKNILDACLKVVAQFVTKKTIITLDMYVINVIGAIRSELFKLTIT